MDSNTSSHQPSSGLNNSPINADLSLWADEVIFGESEGSEDESVSPHLYKNGNVISRSKSYKRRDESVTSPKANGNDSSSRQSGRHITIEMNHEGEENTDDLKNDADSQVDQEDSNGQDNSDSAHVNTGLGIYDDTTADWVDIDLNSDDEEQTNETSNSRPNSISGPLQTGNQVANFIPISTNNAEYLITFIDILYYFALSPVKGDGKNPRKIWGFGCFIVVIMLAILEAFERLKIWMLFGDPGKDVHIYYVRLGYLTGILVLRIWFECLVAFKFKAIIVFIESIKEFGAHVTKKQVTLVVLLPLLTSLTLAVSFPISDHITIFGWTVSDLIPYRAYRFSLLLFTWSTPDDETNDYLWDTYGTNVTFTTAAMGTTDLFLTIIGFLQQNLIRDLCWHVSFTLHSLIVIFQSDLNCSSINTENCSNIWRRYKALKKVSKNLNDAFGLLFQLFHLDNLFFGAYFVYEHIILGRNLGHACLRILLLLEILSFYLLAAWSSLVNSNFREWIHANFCGQNTLFVENGKIVGTINVLDDITHNPIGIGRNMFFIDASFLWKIGSLGGSYSFLFAQADRQ